MNNRKRLTSLLPRDGHLCGVHVGGGGMRIRSRADASLDHIFTKSFFKDRSDGIRPKHYNQEWNCQPMHQECNTERGGQIYGFPLFRCSCHWLQIYRTSKGHVLALHYKTKETSFVFEVTTEERSFVFRTPPTGKFSTARRSRKQKRAGHGSSYATCQRQREWGASSCPKAGGIFAF